MGSLDPSHGSDIMVLQINSNLLGINIYQDLLYGPWDFKDQHRLPFELADLGDERVESGSRHAKRRRDRRGAHR